MSVRKIIFSAAGGLDMPIVRSEYFTDTVVGSGKTKTPPADAYYMRVAIIGGGASGSGASGGGCAASQIVAAETITYTIGAGGAGGSYVRNAGADSTASFGVYTMTGGGAPAPSATSGTTNPGGTSSGGDYNFNGGSGNTGNSTGGAAGPNGNGNSGFANTGWGVGGGASGIGGGGPGASTISTISGAGYVTSGGNPFGTSPPSTPVLGLTTGIPGGGGMEYSGTVGAGGQGGLIVEYFFAS